MSSSRSTNKTAVAATAFLLTLTAATTAQGCRRRASDTAKTPAPPQKAYVRVSELVAQHPLRADVDRLRRAEEALGRAVLATRSTAGTAAADTGLTLPPLAAGTQDAASVRAAAARAARREQARRQLKADFETQMRTFAQERERRQRRLEDQRRDELTALNSIRAAEQQRLARDAAEAAMRAALRDRAADVAAVEAPLSVLEAQLNPGANVFPPVFNQDEFEKDIARLKAAQKPGDTDGIGMQPRLELKRRLLEQKLAQVRQELAAIKARGDEAATAAARQVAEQLEQQIEAELEGLRDDAETRFLARAQEEARNRVLATEAILFGRAQSARQVIAGRNEATTAESLSLGTVFPSLPGATDPARLRQAVRRLAQQRERLEQFIRADVADTIRDVAQQRNIDVVQVPDRTVTDGSVGKLQGRRDMTRQFAAWVRPEDAVARIAGSKRVAPTPLPPLPKASTKL